MVVEFRDGDALSVGAAMNGDSVRSLAAGSRVGVDRESSTGGAGLVAVGFGSGNAVLVGAAVGWSVDADDPHPGRTAAKPDIRTAMAS